MAEYKTLNFDDSLEYRIIEFYIQNNNTKKMVMINPFGCPIKWTSVKYDRRYQLTLRYVKDLVLYKGSDLILFHDTIIVFLFLFL